VLIVHPVLDQGFRKGAPGQEIVVAPPVAVQDLAAHIDQRLDLRVSDAFVLGLDVEDPVAMPDIGIVASDHSDSPIHPSCEAGAPPAPA